MLGVISLSHFVPEDHALLDAGRILPPFGKDVPDAAKLR